jgi:hypothetical protein
MDKPLRTARVTPPPPPPRRAPASEWLDDADLIELHDVRPVASVAARARRYEETQRIWRPRFG